MISYVITYKYMQFTKIELDSFDTLGSLVASIQGTNKQMYPCLHMPFF